MKKTPPTASPNELLQYALNLHQSGDVASANRIYRKLIKLNPKHAFLLYLSGTAEIQQGNRQEGIRLLDKSIQISPDNPVAYFNRGTALFEVNRLQDALNSFERAVQLKPDYAEAYYSRGNLLAELNRLDEAVKSLETAIQLRPDYAVAYYNLGNTLAKLGRLDDALDIYDRLIKLSPDFAETYNNRGNVLIGLDRLQESLDSFDQAIKLNAEYAEAHTNRGNVLKEMGRLDEALASHDRAIQLRSDYAEAFTNKGNVLEELNQLEDAITCHEQAIAINPRYAEAYSNRGNVLGKMRRFDDALQSYQQAIAIDPDCADAWANMGATLNELRQYREAISCYERALHIRPLYAEAWFHKGNSLRELKSYREAIACYEKAIEINPEVEFLFGQYLHAKTAICDWRDHKALVDTLLANIRYRKKVSPPFQVLTLSGSEESNRLAAEIWAADKYGLKGVPGIQAPGGHKRRIHIGYYSADFHSHAMMHLMAEFFEHHDKNRFKLTAFSFGPNIVDEMRERLVAAFDEFIDVRSSSDTEVATLSRNLGIDIAVDLSGYTKGCRPGIFPNRAAPIQVNYLGYPGTMGTGFTDYIIADKTVIPESNQKYFSEKVVYLPDAYQVNDSKRMTSNKVFTHQELGLPESALVFCCFNNNFKITPDTFDCWMRILRQVDGSVLWLLEDNPTSTENLRKEAQQRGVAPERLIFAGRMPFPDHMARHRSADLFLDTLPYNAHTTASDALLAGLPVITHMGDTFAGRVAASLLCAVGLPELVTHTQDEYEALAIRLANDASELGKIKERLLLHRATAPLFDTPRITRHIEDAYLQMFERHRMNLPPEHIYVS